MNFEEVILNLANQLAIDRTANVGTEYRGTKNTRELLLNQKKKFLNEKEIERRFTTHEEDFDIKRFFVCMILNQGEYSINEDLISIDNGIIAYRKYLLENEKYIQWDEKNKEMYGIVLETVLEDKRVSKDEWKILQKLQKKLDINLHKHWLLRIQNDLFNEVNKPKTELKEDKIKAYLKDLQKQGLIFHIEKEGRKYIIPEEIAETLMDITGMEIQDSKYEELLNNTIFTKKDKINFLKKNGIDKRGSNELLNKHIIANRLKPSDFLNSFNTKILGRITTKLTIKKSGTKEQKIKRIINHYNEIYIPTEKTEDRRETYYKFYEDLANRNQSILIKKGIINKGEEVGARFEEATRYLFGNVLGLKLENPEIKARLHGVKADGKASKDKSFIVWDCKTKDKDIYFTMTTAEYRQFTDYINEYKKIDTNRFISLLIITNEIKNPANIRKQLNEIHGETGVNISVIRAKDLKEFAEKVRESKIKINLIPFYNTRILSSNYLENICFSC